MSTEDARRLHIINRWLEVEGELRVALIRVLLITCFYVAELAQYFSATGDPEVMTFHRHVTYICGAWMFVSLAVLVAVAREWLPAWLKYVTSLLDIVFLTAAAMAGSGPASPLVTVYLLLIAMAGMRGSLKLIWFCSLGSLIGYFALLWLHGQFTGVAEHAAFKFVQLRPVAIMVHLLSMMSVGLVTGQMIRMIRQVTAEVGQRQSASQAATGQNPTSSSASNRVEAV